MEFQKPTPLKLWTGDDSAAWRLWKLEFLTWMRAAACNGNPARKRAIFLNMLGIEGQRIVSSFNVDDNASMEEIIQLLDEHFKDRATEVARYLDFVDMKQGEQTISEWMLKVRERCERFGLQQDAFDTLVMGQFVSGLEDRRLKLKLRVLKNPTCQKVFDFALEYERNISVEQQEVDVLRQQPARNISAEQQEVDVLRRQPAGALQCRKCKRDGHLMQNCRMIKCFRCHQYGHMASNCRNPQKKFPGNEEGLHFVGEEM